MKPYPKYKRSGVEWLGDVPDHWQPVALKWITRRYTGGTPDKSNQDYWNDGTIPWLNSGAVNDSYIKEPSTFITKDAFLNSSAKWIPKGALVLALAGQGKTKGMVAQVGFNTTCNQSMAAIIPSSKYSTRFLFWWLHRNYDNLRNLAGGEARDGLNLEMIGAIPCPLLPIPEQQSIAAFLDRETARIDTLIEKNEHLIELLKEKRSALISQAVTKGLNPFVKLKSAGVEWLGDIPEHWEATAIKWITPVLRGISPRPIDDPIYFDENGEFAWVRIADVTASKVYLETTTQQLSAIGARMCAKLLPGSLFLSIAATVGVACITNIKCCVHDGFVYFPKLRADTKYMYYIFASGEPYKGLGKLGTQLNLNTDTVGSIVIGYPPLSEQQAIAAFLDRETGKIESLLAQVESVITQLQEYRVAITNAAVTGKIDVREA
ncbi:MAG: restriction endonuclease subunit S [Dehalococcoidia bacterium]